MKGDKGEDGEGKFMKEKMEYGYSNTRSDTMKATLVTEPNLVALKMASSKSVAMFSFLLLAMLTNVALKADARAFFVFGDSLVDNGNNNFLATTARADNTPYGIDYPTKRPTGRFSNGLNIPDLISESIGAESTLPYLSPELTGQKLLVGANFASAGVGVLNDTGVQFANIIRMPLQMAYLEQYKQRVSEIIGPQETERLITQSLTLVTLGGNDFVNNYYLVPFSARSRQFALPDYVVYVVSEYRKILKVYRPLFAAADTGSHQYAPPTSVITTNATTIRLHELGLRRILITGTGPLGCVPAELAQ
ncbi:hypothetical protein OSB04_un001780, partial [Centaurea solstitialis]